MTISSAEYNDIKVECQRFAKNEIQERALDMDLSPDPAQFIAIWGKSVQLDLPSLLLPEKYQGAAFPDLAAALVLNVLAAECAGVASVFAHHFAACLPLVRCQETISESVGQLVAPAASTPPKYALVFPSETAAEPVTIDVKGDRVHMNGTSELTANAGYADVLCVFGVAPAAGTDATDSVRCVMIPKESDGIGVGENPHLPGLKINPFHTICFDDVSLGSDHIIEPPGNGQTAALLADVTSVYCGYIAALAMGCARTAYDRALAYAGERYQFGDIILNHPEIQRMLGWMQEQLEVGTAAVVQLFTPEALPFPGLPGDGRLVKACCTDAALKIVQEAIQIHGGYGYMHEYGLEKSMRDVKVLQLLGGRNPAHQVQVTAEKR